MHLSGSCVIKSLMPGAYDGHGSQTILVHHVLCTCCGEVAYSVMLYCTVHVLHNYVSHLHASCMVGWLSRSRASVYVWYHAHCVAATHVVVTVSGHDFHAQTRPSSRTCACCSTTHFRLMCEQRSMPHHGFQSSSLHVVNNMQVDCVVSSLRSVSCQVVEML